MPGRDCDVVIIKLTSPNGDDLYVSRPAIMQFSVADHEQLGCDPGLTAVYVGDANILTVRETVEEVLAIIEQSGRDDLEFSARMYAKVYEETRARVAS